MEVRERLNKANIEITDKRIDLSLLTMPRFSQNLSASVYPEDLIGKKER